MMNDDPRRVADQIILDLKAKIDQIYEILIGKGGPDAPGLVVRVDRLEQSDKYRQMKSDRAWQGRLAIYGTLAGLILERIWSHIHPQ